MQLSPGVAERVQCIFAAGEERTFTLCNVRIPRNSPRHFRKEEALASAKLEESRKSANEVSKQWLVHVRLYHHIMMIQSDPVNKNLPFAEGESS